MITLEMLEQDANIRKLAEEAVAPKVLQVPPPKPTHITDVWVYHTPGELPSVRYTYKSETGYQWRNTTDTKGFTYDFNYFCDLLKDDFRNLQGVKLHKSRTEDVRWQVVIVTQYTEVKEVYACYLYDNIVECRRDWAKGELRKPKINKQGKTYYTYRMSKQWL